jgi:hypothetical protein
MSAHVPGVSTGPPSEVAVPAAVPIPRVAAPPEEALAAAVAACTGVAALSGGTFGEVATYLEGRRITGVRMTDDVVEVHVVARWGTPMAVVAQQVRAACAPLAPDRRVDVSIDDVEIPAAPVTAAGARPARRQRPTEQHASGADHPQRRGGAT